jgi:hypothetical protein
MEKSGQVRLVPDAAGISRKSIMSGLPAIAFWTAHHTARPIDQIGHGDCAGLQQQYRNSSPRTKLTMKSSLLSDA